MQKSNLWILLPLMTLTVNACNGGKRDSSNPAQQTPATSGPRLSDDKSAPSTPANAAAGAPTANTTNATITAPQPPPVDGSEATAPVGNAQLDAATLNGSTTALQKIDPLLFEALVLRSVPANGGQEESEGPPPQAQVFKVLNQKALQSADSKTKKVISQGKLETYDSAKKELLKDGHGIFCQTVGAENLKDGDALSVLNMTGANDPENASIVIATLMYQNQDKKPFSLLCTTLGRITPPIFAATMKGVLLFPGAREATESAPAPDSEPTPAPAARPQETKEEAAANDLKMKSFRILKMDPLTKIVYNQQNAADSSALVGGKLTKIETAQSAVTQGKALEACQILSIIGSLQKDKIYQYQDKQLLGTEPDTNISMLAYTYAADDANKVAFFCFAKMPIPTSEMFNVFKGVLEFGVVK